MVVCERQALIIQLPQMKLSEEDFKEQFDIAIKDLLAYNNVETVTEK